MPFYFQLKEIYKDESQRNYVIDRLLQLKKQLDTEIPSKDLDENLLLATWNIRDFGKTNRRGFGKRTKESLLQSVAHIPNVRSQRTLDTTKNKR